ncbi:MAG: type II 3-dehydroquinate dehydratase [Candidatus Omnitrophica bacterium]|nr:type II 3-dehydroquinate dehydratase [Candidatus Omnitrophota bacterium]
MKTLGKILIIHGPNLHLLGKREPEIYGNFTLDQIDQELKLRASRESIEIETFQSNSEGDIVEKITTTGYNLLIINPAAYTHTSVAIRDAILGVNKPTLEVHLSNIYKREDFRKKSLISDIVIGTIAGFGKESYFLAFSAAMTLLESKSSETK